MILFFCWLIFFGTSRPPYSTLLTDLPIWNSRSLKLQKFHIITAKLPISQVRKLWRREIHSIVGVKVLWKIREELPGVLCCIALSVILLCMMHNHTHTNGYVRNREGWVLQRKGVCVCALKEPNKALTCPTNPRTQDSWKC